MFSRGDPYNKEPRRNRDKHSDKVLYDWIKKL